MFKPRDYLVVEYENVERTLTETLRFRYSDSHLRNFYLECSARLEYIKSLFDATDPTDEAGTKAIAQQISAISALITRIERSHLEEFSWPFADALERISKGICSESALINQEPLFFFTAEGDMAYYAVRKEYLAVGIMQRRIFIVIFPRSLKDLVLLHSILGHEIGHAAYATTEVFQELKAVSTKLVQGSPAESPNDLFDWCKRNLAVQHPISDDYLKAQRKSWEEELYCDLFGLIMMGTPFISAFKSLLEPLSFGKNYPYVPSHPTYRMRYLALIHAAKTLGFLYSNGKAGHPTSKLDEQFVNIATDIKKAGVVLLNEKSIEAAAIALRDFMKRYDGLVFPDPDFDLISSQVKCLSQALPPSGSDYGFDDKKNPTLKTQSVDFRHVLFAGWLAWAEQDTSKDDHIRFLEINRLCSQANLQQEGLRFYETNKSNK